MSTLKFINVNKVYKNNVQAVYDFNLEVNDKEFIVFVGPSGCGKSTTLRMIAGLEDITNGEIYIDDVLINDVAPKDRNIAMVFQNYALYPHMTVFDNMAFSLKLRREMFPAYDDDGNRLMTYDHEKVVEIRDKINELSKNKEENQNEIDSLEKQIEEVINTLDMPAFEYRHYSKKEIKERVDSAAAILGLDAYLKRKPSALSGGQRQRVALGRAIVRNPKVFLMDEPLSNLDAKLRVQMRSEISKIHKRVNATTIYVTHDQTEAMTMATRIVCMKDGYIQQIGTPKELYNKPANMFVGGFIGNPPMNFITGKFDGKDFVVLDETVTPKVKVNVDKVSLEKLKEYVDKDVVLGIRPEDVYLSELTKVKNKSNEIELISEYSELLGRELIIYSSIEGQRIFTKTNLIDEIEAGKPVKVVFDLDRVHFFDPETTNRIGD